MTERVSLDARLFGEAQRLLMEYLSGGVPAPAAPRDVVQEQDALDAVVLLTAAITEQLQTGRFAPDVASRMGALLMVVREYVRPLPAAGAGGTDQLGKDLAEMVAVVRSVSPRGVLPRQGTVQPESKQGASGLTTSRFTA